MADGESRPQRHGIVVSRHRVISEPAELHGLRVDRPADVLLSCARHLALLDLVVLVDSALHLDVCTRAEIAAVASRRRQGAPRLRRALEYADARPESAWEVMLLMLHVACGVDVVPQYELRDEHDALVARADLWLVGTNVLHEYDGAHHLTPQQQHRDLGRARRIGNQTWVRRGYTSIDVLQRAVGVLRDADLSLGREHRPERIRTWHRWLAESAYTATGRERLRRRLGLPHSANDIDWRSPA
jgi:hypothetical protein